MQIIWVNNYGKDNMFSNNMSTKMSMTNWCNTFARNTVDVIYACSKYEWISMRLYRPCLPATPAPWHRPTHGKYPIRMWFQWNIHNDFSLALSSLNNANQLMYIRYNNQLTAVEQYFTNIVVIQNTGVLWQIWTYEIFGGMLLICLNTTMRVYGAWMKRCCVLYQKHIAPRVVLSQLPAGSQQAVEAPASVTLV